MDKARRPQNNRAVELSELTTQKTYLIVNGLIVTLVVLSFFLLRRGPRPPVKLDLRNGNPPPEPDSGPKRVEASPTSQSQASTRKRPPGWDNYQPRPRPVIPDIDEEADTSPGRAPRADDGESDDEISLNALFNWNGHTFDAYEALGLPAGSSREKVAAAYNLAVARADRESLPFLKAAFEAIAKS